MEADYSCHTIIEELNEYLLSIKFDSYYDDNLLQPEVGERASLLIPMSTFKGHHISHDPTHGS